MRFDHNQRDAGIENQAQIVLVVHQLPGF
jgi:hypothetical protein